MVQGVCFYNEGENMEIKKSTFKLLLVLGALVVFGALVFDIGSSSGGGPTGNVVSNNGGVQEVVIGMKNYNYYPQTFTVESGKTVRIRLDDTVYGCFRDFTLREFGIREYLRSTTDYVEFVPDKKGTFTFSCSMGMGSGKMIVK
jgi:plastocyanin domain-containing protein